ncbi:MAG: hypothetical protein WC360_03305 [Opitutales bacterium]|jgi:predicted hotdog family 3-hydroxylacyl-ACP dehydratase
MNLLDRLPHKAPALLLDKVLEISPARAACSIAASLHPSLAHDGQMPAPLALEAMAQCAAAWMVGTHPDEEARGMLVQCRNFEMSRRYLDLGSGLRAVCIPVSTGSGTGRSQFSASVENADGDTLCKASFMILTQPTKQ